MAHSGGNDDFEITSINVTPLVDIMLVLLIIFMVTTTYIVKEAIVVDLPRAAMVGSSGSGPLHTIKVTIAKDGRTYLDGVEVNDAALRSTLRQAASGPMADVQAIISADRDARHGSVVHALDLLRSVGVTKFAIQVERMKTP